MIVRNLASVFCLGLTLGSPALAVAADATPHVDGDAAHGRQLFEAVGCYECHGHLGQGGSNGPRIAPNPPPLQAFAALVRNPVRQMPPYSAEVLSAEDLIDIHAYLTAVPPPVPDAQLKLLGDP